MTLGEFKEFTKNMRDDVELKFHYAGGYHHINSFSTSDNTLILVTNNYDSPDIEGVIKAMIKFKKQ